MQFPAGDPLKKIPVVFDLRFSVTSENERQKVADDLGDLAVDGVIILKSTEKKHRQLDSPGPVAGSREYGSEPPVSTKRGEFLECQTTRPDLLAQITFC